MAGGAAPARKGRDFEREVRAALEAAGYAVTRSAGSLGPADLLAVRSVPDGEVLFLQCKRDGRLSPADWNLLLALARHHGGIPVLALRIPRAGPRLYRLTGPKVARAREPPWSPFPL